MKRKLYLAYGSNLSLGQMAARCPDAVPVGTAELPDYRLLFKGSKTGSYLTVEPKKGRKVPLLVWSISEKDEAHLDRYEGCPTFYYKATVEVELKNLLDGEPIGTADAIIYIMHEERSLGIPTFHYYDICAEGYRRFGFNETVLKRAVTDSIGKRLSAQWLSRYYDDEKGCVAR